jgi:hypothetical protein
MIYRGTSGGMWLAEGLVAICLVFAAVWLMLKLLLVLAFVAAVGVLAFLAWWAWLELRDRVLRPSGGGRR